MPLFGRRPQTLMVSYAAITPPGQIDQMVTLTNTTDTAVVPRIRYTPVDAEGRRLQARVHCVYGSDVGRVVVPCGRAHDILVFDGPDEDRVQSVHVDIDYVAYPAMHRATLQPTVDLVFRGSVGDRYTGFDALLVLNSNPEPVNVRVLGLRYDHPAPGRPQQVIAVDELVERHPVPAAMRMLVPLGIDRAGPFDSVQVHLAP